MAYLIYAIGWVMMHFGAYFLYRLGHENRIAAILGAILIIIGFFLAHDGLNEMKYKRT